MLTLIRSLKLDRYLEPIPQIALLMIFVHVVHISPLNTKIVAMELYMLNML